ncbi:hypothetical protein [Salinicoccus albus]|uniref:hypothetical protein n=1 Tax=Salinicoccus albus TaxID=418756 RepID=UPI00036F7A04|nr:hypothetical protein [Salinicoccus albus]
MHHDSEREVTRRKKEHPPAGRKEHDNVHWYDFIIDAIFIGAGFIMRIVRGIFNHLS